MNGESTDIEMLLDESGFMTEGLRCLFKCLIRESERSHLTLKMLVACMLLDDH